MKNIIIIMFLLMTVSARGEGVIWFCNTEEQSGLSAQITDVDGFPVEGAQYKVQLYAGLPSGEESELQAIGGSVTFGEGELAGYWTGVSRTINFVNPGNDVLLQIRAWDSNGGSTYEEAATVDNILIGRSDLIIVTAGTDQSPAVLTELITFNLQPNEID